MIAAAFLSSAAFDFDKSVKVGKTAPKIETVEGINVVNDANSENIDQNKATVISFWSPKNPASRIANKNLSLKYGAGNEDVNFISICTDSNDNLMKEVIKIDNVNPDFNYSYSQISPRAFKDYGVEQSPKAFMIDSDGKVSCEL